MNPPSHHPSPPHLFAVNEASPTLPASFNNVLAMNNANGLLFQLATMLTPVQPPACTPVPQPPQQQPAIPTSAKSASETLALLAQQLQQLQQQSSVAAGSNAGFMSSAQNALIPGPAVGAYPTDEDLLVQALKRSEEAGQTYRMALEGLHGVTITCYL